MVNREELELDFSRLSAMLSAEYIKIFEMVEKEEKAKENNEECDEKIVEKGKSILMHLSHAMGELVESKSQFLDKLSLPDLLCKMQYESEMNSALEAYTKAQSFNDILNEE